MAEGRAVGRDQLIDGLWDVTPPDNARHALQAQVSRLRQSLSLAPDDLVASGRGYHLSAGAVEVDAARFATLARAGRTALQSSQPEAAAQQLREALQLWQGPAFGDLADIPALRAHAVGLDEQRLAAVADRVDADLALGRHEELVAELESLVTDHPLRERLWTQLLIALYGCGRQADALDVYRRAGTVLGEHAGVDPGEALTAAYEAALHQRLPGPAADRRPGGSLEQAATRAAAFITHDRPGDLKDELPAELARRLQGPFVGRRDARDRLRTAWSSGTEAQRLILLAGEPGIGKTRLAAEFANEVHLDGAVVRFGHCDQELAVPYQPFVEILRDELNRHGDTELLTRLGDHPGDLTHLLPDLADRLPAACQPLHSDPETERYRLFEAVASWLRTLSRERPLLLVIDDLQWAGRPTLLLLRHLVRNPRPFAGAIVTTYRDEHRSEALTDTIADLQRDRDVVTRLTLTGLDDAAIGEVLTSELADGAALTSDELTSEVAAGTGGNAFFVVEVARHLAETTSTSTRSTASSRATAPLPDSVRDVVRQRLRRLAPTARRLLACASVAGRDFDARVVHAVTGLDDDDFDRAIGEVTRTRLIELDPQAPLQYQFAHDLTRATVYDDLAPLYRARTHRRIGEATEQLHLADLRPHYGHLAHHFERAATVEDPTTAIDYLILAGDAALDQRASADAVDFYRRALALLPAGTDIGKRCDLLTSLGVAQLRAGDPEYRVRLLESAHCARDDGDIERLTAAVLANSRGWWSSATTIDAERVELIEAALDAHDRNDDVAHIRLLSSWAVETVLDPARRLEAVATSRRAVAQAQEQDDAELHAEVLAHHSTVLYASCSDPDECLRTSSRLVEIARDLDDPGLTVSADLGHAQSAVLVGDLATADRLLDRAERNAERFNHPGRLWMARTWQATRLALRGRLTEAEAASAAALELGTATGQPDALTWFAGQLFTIRWQQGRLAELVHLVEEHVKTESDAVPAWHAAYALALVEDGRGDEAEAILDAFVADGLRGLPRDMLWRQGMSYLCAVCAHLRRPDVAAVLHDALVGHSGLLANNGTIDAGPIDAHLGAMSALAGESDRAAQQLAAAAALCERIDAPVWLARVHRLQQEELGGGAPVPPTTGTPHVGATGR